MMLTRMKNELMEITFIHWHLPFLVMEERLREGPYQTAFRDGLSLSQKVFLRSGIKMSVNVYNQISISFLLFKFKKDRVCYSEVPNRWGF